MLKRILGVWLVAIILSLGGVSMAAELVVLPNGLKVLVQEDNRFPLVSVRLFVRTGSAYEDPKQAGISHLLEHMVFKGTEKRKTGEIAEAIESKGGYLNAATSFDYTVYVMDMPAKHWELALEVLEDMIFHSRFDEQELEKEKNVVLAELERGEDNPGQKLFKTIQAKLFQGSPYARPII
ncbi:MAG TPA: peptidase M16, partial [Desulfonauticus sp.]|nr:peptidase M16 [Desulfonauticus sp.]